MGLLEQIIHTSHGAAVRADYKHITWGTVRADYTHITWGCCQSRLYTHHMELLEQIIHTSHGAVRADYPHMP